THIACLPSIPTRRSSDLVKVRIPAKNGAVPPEVAAGLNQVFAVNQRMAQELEELRRERKDLLRALEAFEEGDFAARAAEGPSGSPVVRALNNVIGMKIGRASCR